MAILIASLMISVSVSAEEPASPEKRPPNELGKIMVLMYHELGPKESTWRRTPENFQKDLETLYREGYRPIPLRDFVTGNIQTKKGFTPVIITFDDGTAGQFQWSADDAKVPDVNSVVGILSAFHDQNPDFPLAATFFLHGTRPFGKKSEVRSKLQYLVEHGMDIGNHTTAHQNIHEAKYQNPTAIQRIVGKQAQYLTTQISGEDEYTVDTLALCYGRRPKLPWLNRYLHSGRFGEFVYKNIAVLNVGAGPSYSPYDDRFNPLSIPRIRASETNTFHVGLYDWLNYFDEHPEERFVSDGDSSTVTVLHEHQHLDTERLNASKQTMSQKDPE